MTFTTRTLRGLGQAFVDRAGPLAYYLVDGLATTATDIDELVTPGPRGYPQIVDLNTTRHPAWVGQVGGTIVPPGLSIEQQRDYIRASPSRRRGTPAAMLAAIRVVFPIGRVDILERQGGPWKITVRVYGDTNQNLIHNAALTQKPVGIILTTEVVTGATYTHMRIVHGPTFDDFANDFDTYRDATSHVPEEGTVP